MNELIVFAKAPRIGQVKTRLAQAIGAAEACEAYRTLLAALGDTLRFVEKGVVQFSPADGQADLVSYFPAHLTFVPQCGGDLGKRLFVAFEESFARGATRTAIIGSDCPFVQREDLEAAWSALGRSDMVFGPAEDGGYWLVGARRSHREMFCEIDWGGADVLQQNLQNCARLGLSVELLRTLHDVDTREDWERYLASRGGAVTSA